MGNVFKKRSSNVLQTSTKGSLTSITETNKKAEPTILIVCDNDYMNDEMTQRIYSKTENQQLEGHRMKGIDLESESYLFYGGRGGYRPFRRTIGNDVTALILCIDSTKKTQASHFSVIGRAISSVTGDKKIPLLVIGVPPNQKGKDAAKKVQQEQAKLVKKRREQAIKMAKKGKNDKKNGNESVEVPEADTVVEEIIETEPMNSTEIETTVTNTLALQTNVLFSTYHIISVPSSEDHRSFNDDLLLSEGLNWLKGQLNPEVQPSTTKISVDVKKMKIDTTSIEGGNNNEIIASA